MGELSESIIVALLSCMGTIVGSWLGILKASKLTNFRIEQLEKKVDKHNTVIERTYRLEEQVKEISADIKELKSYHRKGMV